MNYVYSSIFRHQSSQSFALIMMLSILIWLVSVPKAYCLVHHWWTLSKYLLTKFTCCPNCPFMEANLCDIIITLSFQLKELTSSNISLHWEPSKMAALLGLFSLFARSTSGKPILFKHLTFCLHIPNFVYIKTSAFTSTYVQVSCELTGTGKNRLSEQLT